MWGGEGKNIPERSDVMCEDLGLGETEASAALEAVVDGWSLAYGCGTW